MERGQVAAWDWRLALGSRFVRAGTATRGRLQLLDALLHRGAFLVREFPGGHLRTILRRVAQRTSSCRPRLETSPQCAGHASMIPTSGDRRAQRRVSVTRATGRRGPEPTLSMVPLPRIRGAVVDKGRVAAVRGGVAKEQRQRVADDRAAADALGIEGTGATTHDNLGQECLAPGGTVPVVATIARHEAARTPAPESRRSGPQGHRS
jgi:hypothetical protein